MASFPDSFYILFQSLTLLNIIVLSVGFACSLVAVRGYRGAPINRVLRPLPIVFACMIVVNMPWASLVLFSLPYANAIYGVVFSVGVLAAAVASFRATMLLTERRDL